MKVKIILFFVLILFINQVKAEENIMIMKLKDGDVVIELFPDIAPKPCKKIQTTWQ